jgi:hypothetical protein
MEEGRHDRERGKIGDHNTFKGAQDDERAGVHDRVTEANNYTFFLFDSAKKQ